MGKKEVIVQVSNLITELSFFIDKDDTKGISAKDAIISLSEGLLRVNRERLNTSHFYLAIAVVQSYLCDTICKSEADKLKGLLNKYESEKYVKT